MYYSVIQATEHWKKNIIYRNNSQFICWLELVWIT